jgi:hypothetical protein
MSLKIAVKEGQALLQECGYQEAKEFSAARTKKKLEALPKALTEDNKPESKQNKKLLKQIQEEMSKEDGEIVIADEDGDTEEAAPVEKKKAPAKEEKKSSKKAAAEEEDEEDEDEEDDDEDTESDEDEDEEEEDDEDEEEAPKKASKKDKKAEKSDKKADKEGAKRGPPASAATDGGPGIIASIVEFLQEATEDKPLTKEKLLDKLEKRFPARSRDAMKKTVNVQVPGRIKNDKKMEVGSVETKSGAKGFWINPDNVEAKPTKKAKKAAKKVEAEDDED